MSVKTTEIYTHVLNRGGRGVLSPLDNLARPPNSANYADHNGGLTSEQATKTAGENLDRRDAPRIRLTSDED